MAQLTALANMGKSSIANSGGSELSVMIPIENINLKDEFKNLFPLNENMVDIIAENISAGYYDKSQPIHVWKEGMILVDGHHRLAAAKKAGLKEIPVFYHHFKDLEEALTYAIKLQTDRRNLSDGELLKTLETLDKLKIQGKQNIDSNIPQGKSAEITAKKIGVSRAKIERARTVQNKASEEIKKAVEQGEMTINAAYNATMQKEKKAKKEIFKEWINIEERQPEENEKILFIAICEDESINGGIFEGVFTDVNITEILGKTFEYKYWLPISVLPKVKKIFTENQEE